MGLGLAAADIAKSLGAALVLLAWAYQAEGRALEFAQAPAAARGPVMQVGDPPQTVPGKTDVGAVVAPPMPNSAILAEHVAALIARARAHHARGDYDRAREDSSEALRLNPQSVDALLVRADALAAVKQFDKAIDDYDAAIKLDPENAKLFALRAAKFASMHEPRLAVRDYTESIRLNPKEL